MTLDPRAAAVLDFWFGTDSDDAAVAEQNGALWFGGSAEQDRVVRDLFGQHLQDAEAGLLDGWAATPRGCLALIVVLDQFSRMIGRDTPRAFANDTAALGWARRCIDSGDVTTLRPIERSFVFLPLEHSEDLGAQAESVSRCAALVEEVPAAWHEVFRRIEDFARRHEVVIQRFGRFPHRNETLGRLSTSEEIRFLKDSGLGF